VKFIHGSSVKNSQRTKIIAKSLEIAKDRSVSTKNPTEEEVNFSDEEITKNVALSKDNAEQNKNIRNASMVNQITTETISEITSKGKLRGVRKIKEYTQNEGKTFVAVYTWSSRDNSAASEMRKKMTEKN
jgi:hypothetical protein